MAEEGVLVGGPSFNERVTARWNQLLAKELGCERLTESRREVWNRLSGDRVFELYHEAESDVRLAAMDER